MRLHIHQTPKNPRRPSAAGIQSIQVFDSMSGLNSGLRRNDEFLSFWKPPFFASIQNSLYNRLLNRMPLAQRIAEDAFAP